MAKAHGRTPTPVSSVQPGQARKLPRYMEAAQRYLENPSSLAYLEARKVPVALARTTGVGYFPPGTWQGRKNCRRVGRIAFPLHGPDGELTGVYSRAVDPQYPEKKAPEQVRHDIWGKRGIFNPGALTGPALYLTESCFDAMAMLAAGYPTSAALVGTKGLRWGWLSQVQELYLCGDVDVEGMKAAPGLAKEAVLHGVRTYMPSPADQWEKESRVTLRICKECDIAIHPPTAERCPHVHGSDVPGLSPVRPIMPDYGVTLCQRLESHQSIIEF